MIIPAILTSNPRIASERIALAREMSGWVHIDILDNTLYPFESLALDEWQALEINDLFVELHCMINDPVKLLDDGFIPDRIVIHYEAPKWEAQYISLVNKGIDVWVAIDPNTKLEDVQLPKDLTGVLLMGVEPGQTGQEFLEETYSRLEYLAEHHPDLSVTVDGGVHKDNIRTLLAHGADNLIMGSALFHQVNPVEAYRYYEHSSDPVGGAFDYQPRPEGVA